MKSYDEIEKVYADMVADGKISDRLRTLLKEKTDPNGAGAKGIDIWL